MEQSPRQISDQNAPENSPLEAETGASADLRQPLLYDGLAVWDDLPLTLPITSEEIALLRAFLALEITAILDGQDEVGEKV